VAGKVTLSGIKGDGVIVWLLVVLPASVVF